jgi:hypothetical protein
VLEFSPAATQKVAEVHEIAFKPLMVEFARGFAITLHEWPFHRSKSACCDPAPPVPAAMHMLFVGQEIESRELSLPTPGFGLVTTRHAPPCHISMSVWSFGIS